MIERIAVAFLIFGGLTVSARAGNVAALREGRSIGGATACLADALVCATMRDGRSVPTSECEARKDGAVRILFGDCYDED